MLLIRSERCGGYLQPSLTPWSFAPLLIPYSTDKPIYLLGRQALPRGGSDGNGRANSKYVGMRAKVVALSLDQVGRRLLPWIEIVVSQGGTESPGRYALHDSCGNNMTPHLVSTDHDGSGTWRPASRKTECLY